MLNYLLGTDNGATESVVGGTNTDGEIALGHAINAMSGCEDPTGADLYKKKCFFEISRWKMEISYY